MESLTSLLVAGVSHRTAPAEVRGLFARVTPTLLADCRSQSEPALSIPESVVLSTCNRLEVYAAAQDPVRVRADIEGALAAAAGGGFEQIRPAVYFLEDRDAARHLMRVAAGLDSMVLGETQILGQVSRAIHEAVEAKTVGPLLSRLFASAIHAARQAHRGTAISRFPTSISHAAVNLLRRQSVEIDGCRILLAGAGTMATLSARVLQKHGAPSLAFINRSVVSAAAAARSYGASVYAWDDLPAALAWADVAIVATGGNQPVIHRADVAVRAASGRPFWIIDLAVPPNVAPEVGGLQGVRLVGIDQLDSQVDENLGRRRAAVPNVEQLIDQELARFMNWCASRQIAPLITGLRRKLELVADRELQLAFNSATGLDREQRDVLTQLVRRVTNKLLHEPTVRLKSPNAASRNYHHAVRDLFGLGEADRAAGGI